MKTSLNRLATSRLGLAVLGAIAALVVVGLVAVPLLSKSPTDDPLAHYTALIDRVRAELTQSLRSYEAGDSSGAFSAARSAYLDSFELVESPLRQRDADLTLEMEDAFARLRAGIKASVPVADVTNQITRLQIGMDDVERTISLEGYAPFVVAGTAFVIVFRGGIEALLVLTAILAYLAATRAARYRRAVLAGTVAAIIATAATWFLLQWIIQIAPVRPAVVQAIPAVLAVGVLVAFAYWLLARLDQRRWLEFMSAKVFAAVATGSGAALFTLAFTSVYRPGFEGVAFVQGLLAYTRGLEPWLVVGGAAGVGALAATAFGVLRMGRRLPLTAFLSVSLVLVMAISVAFIGNAVRSLQEAYLIGITNLTASLPRLPIFLAQATGYHPTLESIAAQLALIAAYGIGGAWLFTAARRRKQIVAPLLAAA